MGKALKDDYRDKTYVATKSPIWNVTRHDNWEKVKKLIGLHFWIKWFIKVSPLIIH